MAGRRGVTSVSKADHGKVSGRARTARGAKATLQRSASNVRDAATADLPMLRNSERGTLKKCEFLWWLTYVRKLKPQQEMPYLRFGSLCHQALAAYYIPGVKRGKHPALAFETAYRASLRENEQVFGTRAGEEETRWTNALELGIAMMNNYVDEYGTDDNWEVLVTEHPFECVVLHPPCDLCGSLRKPSSGCPSCHGLAGQPWFLYVGILDGVWRHRGDKTLWIPDHKTTSGIGDKNWAHLTIDDQAGGYWSWGVDALIVDALMRKNQKLNGMLYNIMRKSMPDERASKFVNGKRLYLNKDGSISQKQPSPYFKRQPIFRDEFDRDLARQRSMIDFKRIQMFLDGTLEVSKTPGMFTCPTCPMRDACELHETGADFEGFLAQTAEAWDPYAQHEIYAGR